MKEAVDDFEAKIEERKRRLVRNEIPPTHP